METSLPPALNDVSIRVHPATDVLPENGTTIRIFFPEAVALGGQQIYIATLNGEKMEGILGRWVWNEGRTMVRLEPTGLQAGTKVAVVVRALQAESGRTIVPFSKTFSILPADTVPPSGAHLQARLVNVPGKVKDMEVVFSEPIRWESLGALSVLCEGVAVSGTWRLGPHQTRAYFTPERSWSASTVYVNYGAGIHDLAGNQMVDIPAGMNPVGR